MNWSYQMFVYFLSAQGVPNGNSGLADYQTRKFRIKSNTENPSVLIYIFINIYKLIYIGT